MNAKTDSKERKGRDRETETERGGKEAESIGKLRKQL